MAAPAQPIDHVSAGRPSVLTEFDRWVRERPQAPAVLTATESLSYAELDAAADAVAARLVAAGATPGRIVAVVADLSATLVVAELAAMKLGCAFLPIAPTDPLSRTRTVLDEADVVAVVADRELDVPSLLIPDVLVPDLAERSAEHFTDDPHPEQLAYVIYTSGSSGRPKGVQVPHRGLANAVAWGRREWELGPDDRTALFASPAFDASVLEIWKTFATGGALVIPGADDRGSMSALRDWLVRRGVTHCDLPTAVAEGVVELDWPADTKLRVLRTGGDRLTRFTPPGLPFLFVNEYGPAECSVVATFSIVPTVADGVPAIGTPVDGIEALVLDEDLRPATEGEIYLGGAGLARGYLGRPGLTAQRFVPDPRGGGARLYRTGDRAVVREDGQLSFLGRGDNQVKIRGYRIELGEIETALNGHPSVRKAAVLARQDQPGEKELVGYVALEPGTDPDLAAYLRGALPEYLVPARYVVMDELPVTVNGKVDRRALPAPPRLAGDTTAPRTPTEHAIARLWCAELGLDSVGVFDDFLAIGGQSLMALRIATRVEQELGKPVRAHHLFANPTIAALAAVVDELAVTTVDDTTTDEPVVSFAQQRLWFTEQLLPDTSRHTEAMVVGLSGPLDRASLQAAVEEIMRRHDQLRAGFTAREGQPVPFVVDDVTVAIPEVDLRDRPPSARDELIESFAHTVFDLTQPPLIKFALLRLAEHRHELLFATHHIASDGWSARVFVHELGELYRAFVAGLPSPLPPLAATYGDIARRQRAQLASGRLDDGLAFWRALLDPPPAEMPLPTDRPRPSEPTHRGKRLDRAVPAELWDAVQRLARDHGATNFHVLFAVFQAVLRRYTGQDDLVSAIAAAGREDPDAAGLLGFFVNTLPVRTDLAGDPSFADLLDRVRGVLLDATRHGEVPLERIVEHVGADRDLSRHPLFQTMFVLQDTVAPVHAGELTVSLGPEYDNGMAKLDLLINFDFPFGKPMLTAEYATELFDPATIERILRHYEDVLWSVTADPGVRLSELPLGHDEVGFVAPRPTECLHTLVEQQVARTPHAIALECAGATLTYTELDRRANAVACALAELGVGPDVLVATHLERTLDLVVGILGVLKAGGAYLPLSIEDPAARQAAILSDAKASVLLTDGSHPDGVTTPHVLQLADVPPGTDRRPNPVLDVENLAYLLYTSGSTGQPKGCAMPHRAVINMLTWQRTDGGLGAPARVLQFTALTFDVSMQEIFGTLAVGGTVVMVEDTVRRDSVSLLDFLCDNRIERLFLPFVALNELAATIARTGRIPARLVDVVTAGEQVQANENVVGMFTKLPQARLHNHYGPTETHIVVACTLDEDPARWAPLPPIGVPVNGVIARVLDAHGAVAPVGVVGELHIGGHGIAHGYLGKPVQTAQRFIPDHDGKRLYRTGDLARCDADGVIWFLGRTDDQVKIRGYRVELGEIEVALAEHPEVAAAAVVYDKAAQRLVGYILAEDDDRIVAQCRERLSARLPGYMVPSVIMAVATLPRGKTGKLDRKSLPEPVVHTTATPAQSALEAVVIAVFAEALDLDRVGRDDDFFDLGGHSLIATRLVALLGEALGVAVPVRDLFINHTPGKLAAQLHDAHGSTVDDVAAALLGGAR
ncbi:non-ribosomal peptide synthetase [Labedaea rhizosphaerae]|uniref:Amino acid adenylation domain-containing protein n=1 Tax=Labedaea rhizosphaerae TaxID=598644 RepID=A0A4R6SFT7_LABRH|nr:non-ribosomal peptide synthetase [Labedaea rhizosphaerae]TDP97976.1 amino acid adenylation domain-containing protein [Labedaea rhizosphaerae]